MPLAIPLTVLLALATPLQAPADDRAAAAVAPVLGDEVAVVVHLNLMTWDARATLRSVLGELADEELVRSATKAAGAWADALKRAGARDLFVLIDLADMPGLPVAAVPLAGGADGAAIARVLSGGGLDAPVRWPAVETIRGAVIAGTPEAVARIRAAEPGERPEVAAALAAGGEAPVRVAIAPTPTLRRALEESVATLPEAIGGGPITRVSRGLRWASLALAIAPKPTLRAVVQAEDAHAARVLRRILREALDGLAGQVRRDPELAELAGAIGAVTPEAQGDRITLEADLEKASALAAVPLRRAREAALRAQCTNNLKQIALAMHIYHSAHDAFPGAYNTSPDGRPLLSWRVHILPYLEQKALYEEFRRDEPWDSPHNQALISRMPAIYACPGGGGALARDGKTTYLTPRGPDTIFPGARGIKVQEITDGTSSTILVVDADTAAAIVWTKPDDWEAPPAGDARGLFGRHPGGTNVAYGDGSVKFLRETIAPRILRALVTRAGGEVVGETDR